MSDEFLCADHHFARQCTGRGGNSFSDEEDDFRQPPWLHARAFEPTRENPHISGAWIERVAGSWKEQLQRVRQEFKNSRRNINKNYQLAILGVGNLQEIGRRMDRELHVLFTPDEEQKLPSHAEIRGIKLEDHALQQRLADAAQIEPICERST